MNGDERAPALPMEEAGMSMQNIRGGCGRIVRWPGPTPAPAAPGFDVTVQNAASDVVVVEPWGELDMLTCSDFEQQLEKHLCEPGCRRMVVDLGRLSFLAACGVTGLLRARDVATEHGTELRLVINTAAVARLMDVAGVRTEFVVHSTRTAALDSCGPASQYE